MPNLQESLRAYRGRRCILVVDDELINREESLQLGAIDFVPKPYPAVDVVLARVLRIIELSEDREIIQSTERDELTGLLNKEFFYRYAAQFDQHHPETETDAASPSNVSNSSARSAVSCARHSSSRRRLSAVRLSVRTTEGFFSRNRGIT